MAESWRILLVEDDDVFASVLARSLLRRGHEVSRAADTDEARGLAAVNRFSHAILDLKLARESSLPLIPDLLGQQPGLSILILTGYASIQTAVEAVKLGAVNYLCKPADTDAILHALAAGAPVADVPIADNPLSVDRLEWEHIQRVLAEHDHNISATARALGMHRRTLQRKLAKRPVSR